MNPEWLLTGSVTQLVLAIISKDTRTPLERWVFDVKLVEPAPDSTEPCDVFPATGLFLILMSAQRALCETRGRNTVGDSRHPQTDHLDGHILACDPGADCFQYPGVHF